MKKGGEEGGEEGILFPAVPAPGAAVYGTLPGWWLVTYGDDVGLSRPRPSHSFKFRFACRPGTFHFRKAPQEGEEKARSIGCEERRTMSSLASPPRAQIKTGAPRMPVSGTPEEPRVFARSDQGRRLFRKSEPVIPSTYRAIQVCGKRRFGDGFTSAARSGKRVRRGPFSVAVPAPGLPLTIQWKAPASPSPSAQNHRSLAL